MIAISQLSDQELTNEIKCAQRRKEVSRLEGLIDLPSSRISEATWELRNAINTAQVYLDEVRKDCLRILRGK